MAAKRLVPLEFGLIDEGRLQVELNEEVQLASKELLRFKKKHGDDVTLGAKVAVTLKLTLKLEEDDMVSVRGDISRKTPSRPARASMVMEDQEQDGTPTLFVRKGGSSHDTPEQGTLEEVVDVETGEIKRRRKDKSGE